MRTAIVGIPVRQSAGNDGEVVPVIGIVQVEFVRGQCLDLLRCTELPRLTCEADDLFGEIIDVLPAPEPCAARCRLTADELERVFARAETDHAALQIDVPVLVFHHVLGTGLLNADHLTEAGRKERCPVPMRHSKLIEKLLHRCSSVSYP